MSIIIYGPQGCGKSLNAERLRKYFGMAEIVDDGSDPYPLTERQQIEFKEGTTLYLTHIFPRHKDYSTSGRRVIPYLKALSEMENRNAHV